MLKRNRQDTGDATPAASPASAPLADPEIEAEVESPEAIESDVAGAPIQLEVQVAEEDEQPGRDDDGADLLKVFSATQIETEDRTLFLKMAGDVDIDDVIAELQLVAAAFHLGGAELRDAA